MVLLRELLPHAWQHLLSDPLANNIAASQLTVLYCKVCLEVLQRLHSRFTTNYTRILFPMLLSSLLLFWPLFDTAPIESDADDPTAKTTTSNWSWRLNALVPAVMMARFIYKGWILRDPDDIEVQTLSRGHAPSELLFGPLQFSAILVYLGWYRFMSQEAVVQAAAIGIGDGLAAPLVGGLYGRHHYQAPLASKKTMEGSVVGVFLGTVAGIYLYLYLTGIELLPLRLVLAYGGIAAVVEGTAPGNVDNLFISVALHLSFDRVQEWLPA